MAKSLETVERTLVSTVTEQHDYVYASGKLLRETVTTTEGDTSTTETLDFFYDASGAPYALKANGTTYYYVTNLQGDVVQLVNSSGSTVASYEYDPYGNIISQSGDMSETNPLRYRSYYYDSETGFYYLQSRYYDPTICRFINADTYSSTGQGLIGYNMFAYCLNNPTMLSDPSGELGVVARLVVGALIGAVVGAVSAAATGGNITDILINTAASTISGAIIGATGNVKAGRAAGALIAGAGTYIDCRVNGVSKRDSLMCATATAAIAYTTASLSAEGGNTLTSTMVDCTFGFGGGLVSSGISAGVINASQSKSETSTKSYSKAHTSSGRRNYCLKKNPQYYSLVH